MVHIIDSRKNGTYFISSKAEIWEIKSTKKLMKFNRWIQRHKIMPGDIIPKRVIKRYYKIKK